MDDKSKMLEACKFLMSEIVLCYEPDPIKARMLYDAKILDADVTKDEKGKKVFEYYIHFQGWNKSWDRWILENQILKANEINRSLQTKLYNEAIRQKKRKPKSSKNESGDEKDDKSVTSMGSVNSDDVKVIQLPMVSLDIPKVLAVRLEDDCYNIKRKKKLIHLPRKPTVNEIFNEYYAHCEKVVKTPDGRHMNLKVIYEVVHGLNTYFNYFLFSLFLYNFEREQYQNYFPEQEPLSLSTTTTAATTTTTTTTTTHITPKLASPNSVVFSDSSRSNSRTSSFCEDGSNNSVSTPLLKEVLKTKTNRKRRSERKSLSVDEATSPIGTTKRQRNTPSFSAVGASKESQQNVECDGKLRSRETRSCRKTLPQDKEKLHPKEERVYPKEDKVYPKEEKAIRPMEILEENIIDMKRTTTRSKTYGHKESAKISKQSPATSKKTLRENDKKSKVEMEGKENEKATSREPSTNAKKTYTQKDDDDESEETAEKTDDQYDVSVVMETFSIPTNLCNNKDDNVFKETPTSKEKYDKNDVPKETCETTKNTWSTTKDKSSTKKDRCSTTKDTCATAKDTWATTKDTWSTIEDTCATTKTYPTTEDMCPTTEDMCTTKNDMCPTTKDTCDATEDTCSTTKDTWSDKEDEKEVEETSLNSKKTHVEKEDEIEASEKSMEEKVVNEEVNATRNEHDEKEAITMMEVKVEEDSAEYTDCNRLRRSVRGQKCPNAVCESDEQETLPMGSTAKSLQETYKRPSKHANKSHAKESGGTNEKAYMIYPQLSNGDTPADIYGLEHLLRLFVKLPVLLSSSNIDEPKMVVILKYVSQFLEYLAKRTDLFVDSTTVYSESII